MGSSESIKKEKIKLSAKQDGNPDWTYMENFIIYLYSRQSTTDTSNPDRENSTDEFQNKKKSILKVL